MSNRLGIEEEALFIRRYYKEYSMKWLLANKARTHKIYVMAKRDDTKVRVLLTMEKLRKERDDNSSRVIHEEDLTFYNK